MNRITLIFAAVSCVYLASCRPEPGPSLTVPQFEEAALGKTEQEILDRFGTPDYVVGNAWQYSPGAIEPITGKPVMMILRWRSGRVSEVD